MPKQAVRKKAASDRSVRKDGFVFASSGLDAILVDYLYNQVPDGKRRDQMKRLMLLGLMQELGIQNDSTSFIPPRPIELSGRVLPSTLEEPFLERSTSAKTFNNKRSHLIDNENHEAPTVNERITTRSISSSAENKSTSNDQTDGNHRSYSDVENGFEETESLDDTINGLSIQALMAFKG